MVTVFSRRRILAILISEFMLGFCELLYKRIGRHLLGTVYSLGMIIAAGCQNHPQSGASAPTSSVPMELLVPEPTGAVSSQHVVVAAVRWDQRPEQMEMHTLLASNGIPMFVDGSLIYDILVPADKAEQALRLLRTNHLFLEGKIRVGTPTSRQ